MNELTALDRVASWAAQRAADLKPGEFAPKDSCMEYRGLGEAFGKLAELGSLKERPTFLAASEACHQRADAISDYLADAVRSLPKPADGI